MRMVRWMCGVKLKDRLRSKELRERLGIDDSFGIAASVVVLGLQVSSMTNFESLALRVKSLALSKSPIEDG